MYAVSSDFLQAIRGAHASVSRVEVWNAGTKLIPDLAFTSGTVTVDGVGTGVRRKLDLTIPGDGGTTLWGLLAPIGTELVVYRGVRFPNATTELVPLGVFVIDSQTMGYGAEGSITLTAPDRWAIIQRARFLQPVKTVGGAVTQALALAVGGVNVTTKNLATSTATTRTQTWDRDRDQAVNELAKAGAALVYFDRDGSLLATNVPVLSNMAVWQVDAGASGVLVSATRSRDRSRTFNTVVTFSESTDGVVPFTPQIAYDNDASSPTYTGGPFGIVPTFYSSPLLTTAAQALAAAKAILATVKGLAAQLTLESAVNPALDAGDVITVVMPDGTVERHLIDTVTIPLDVGTAQQISTRSTRPEGDVP